MSAFRRMARGSLRSQSPASQEEPELTAEQSLAALSRLKLCVQLLLDLTPTVTESYPSRESSGICRVSSLYGL